MGAGSSPGKGPRASLHLGSISWLGGGVLLPQLCLLIPHIPLALAHPCRERTLLVLAHTPNSLRHTSHLVSQLGVPGLSWTTTQLLWGANQRNLEGKGTKELEDTGSHLVRTVLSCPYLLPSGCLSGTGPQSPCM